MDNLQFRLISKDGRALTADLDAPSKPSPRMSRVVVQNGSVIQFDSQKYFDIVKGNTGDNTFNLVFSKPLSFNNSNFISCDKSRKANTGDRPTGVEEYEANKTNREFRIDLEAKSMSSLNSG